jgi:hypothetical protein
LDHSIVQAGWAVFNEIDERSGPLKNLGPLDGSDGRPTLICKNKEVGNLRYDEGAKKQSNHLACQPLRPHMSEDVKDRFHWNVTSAVNVYPPPHTVLIKVGILGSISIFFRNRLT